MTSWVQDATSPTESGRSNGKIGSQGSHVRSLCGAHGIAMSLLILKAWASWRGKGNRHVQHAQTGVMAGDKNCPFHMLFHRMSYTNSRSLVVHQNGSQKDALQILHVTSTATQSSEGTCRVSNSIRFSNIFHHPM